MTLFNKCPRHNHLHLQICFPGNLAHKMN
jgi:hypothetical protein